MYYTYHARTRDFQCKREQSRTKNSYLNNLPRTYETIRKVCSDDISYGIPYWKQFDVSNVRIKNFPQIRLPCLTFLSVCSVLLFNIEGLSTALKIRIHFYLLYPCPYPVLSSIFLDILFSSLFI